MRALKNFFYTSVVISRFRGLPKVVDGRQAGLNRNSTFVTDDEKLKYNIRLKLSDQSDKQMT